MSYYDENAEAFFQRTINVDISGQYKDFLSQIPVGGHILDAGCGSGRDAKCFMERGYKVSALDASEEMCKLASQYIGINVEHKTFQEIDAKELYDGIWASATLLHIPSEDLPEVLKNLHTALKETGSLYASFKYGAFDGERNGRYFHDLDESSANEVFTGADFKVLKCWITEDVRAEYKGEKWLNILCEK